MKHDELFQVGKIVRSFGSKGEMVLQFDAGILDRIKKLESVFVKIGDNLIPFFIERVERRPKNQTMIKFLDIESSEDATPFAGCFVFIPSALLAKAKGAQLYSYDIEGYKVIDAVRGETGIVTTVLEMPQQSLLAIDLNGKEILIPIVDEIIKNIDKKNKTIYIEAPEGLIDLYL